MRGEIVNELENARISIEEIDKQMAELFQRRMDCARVIGAYKKENGIPIKDFLREQALTEKNLKYISNSIYKPYYGSFLRNIIGLSCEYQSSLTGGVEVFTDTGSYSVTVEGGALNKIGKLLPLNGKALIVTDSGVPKEYIEKVKKQCASPFVAVIGQGEANKSLNSLTKILQTLFDNTFTRSDCIIALGGGLVGDLAGFAASCYMRGIAFYNIPTTLLSQLDSSIGGKTAINFNGIKNSVGAFYHPRAVIIDTDVLNTLNDRLFNEGLAEAIKMSATCDSDLFAYFEQCDNIRESIGDIIKRALSIKRNIVTLDTREAGLRRVLNFGHTVGHAIESAKHGELLHGECVALGMLCLSGGKAHERLKSVLGKYRLPVKCDVKREELLPYLRLDKKSTGEKITAVTVNEIGSFDFVDMTPEEILKMVVRI